MPEKKMICVEDEFVESCRSNKLDIVKACIAFGVDVNMPLNQHSGNTLVRNDTALMFAITKNYSDLCGILLSHPKIDVGKKDNQNRNALNLAASLGRHKIIPKMLQIINGNSEILNNQDKSGDTSLMSGIKSRSESSSGYYSMYHESVESWLSELVRTKVNINWDLKNNYGDNVLSLALKRGSKKVVKILLEHTNLAFDVKHLKSLNLLKNAVESVREYLQDKERWRGSYLRDMPRIPDNSLLMTSLKNDCKQFVPLLVEAFPDSVNTPDSDNEAPLAFCLRNNDRDTAKILLDAPRIKTSAQMGSTERKKKTSAPECPVCLEEFKVNEHIYQCTRGHFVCKRCWPQVQRTHCPKCREKMLGRAFDFEIFLQNIFEK